jgi:nucleotidyltransferase-like protein
MVAICDHRSLVNTWDGREHAESLRQWPTLAAIALQAENHASVDALLALGSLARGSADEASDLDLVVLVSQGRFDRVWADRDAFVPPRTFARWDQTDDVGQDEGVRKFITRDVVKVELVFTTGESFALAEPYAVLVGDPSVAGRFSLRPPITDEELKAYAHGRIASGAVPEVEIRYGELMRALRGELERE